jgi:hypothetical protein
MNVAVILKATTRTTPHAWASFHPLHQSG